MKEEEGFYEEAELVWVRAASLTGLLVAGGNFCTRKGLRGVHAFANQHRRKSLLPGRTQVEKLVPSNNSVHTGARFASFASFH
jgi:hypothetical protein